MMKCRFCILDSGLKPTVRLDSDGIRILQAKVLVRYFVVIFWIMQIDLAAGGQIMRKGTGQNKPSTLDIECRNLILAFTDQPDHMFGTVIVSITNFGRGFPASEGGLMHEFFQRIFIKFWKFPRHANKRVSALSGKHLANQASGKSETCLALTHRFLISLCSANIYCYKYFRTTPGYYHHLHQNRPHGVHYITSKLALDLLIYILADADNITAICLIICTVQMPVFRDRRSALRWQRSSCYTQPEN